MEMHGISESQKRTNPGGGGPSGHLLRYKTIVKILCLDFNFKK